MRRRTVSTSGHAALRPRAAALVLVALVALVGGACSADEGTAGTTSTTDAPASTTTSAPSYDAQLRAGNCEELGLAEGLSCEVLVVPEDRGDPTGRQVELPVVRTSTPVREGDAPVVVLHGGPGGGLVDSWASWTTVLDDLGHQIVLYDQRGGGRARPRLDCPEHTAALAADLAAAGEWHEEHSAIGAALAGCHERLGASGVDLDDYDTPSSTRDLEDLRRALGVEQLTLVGSSYGSRLALDYLRTYPDRVAALVLDGADPPDELDVAPSSRAEEAVDRLLRACEQDRTCAGRYPDLGDVLDRATAAFDESPRPVSVPGPDGSPSTMVVTGDDLFAGLYVAMYDSDVIPLLPSLISAIEGDGGTILDTFASRVVPALSSTAAGAYLSIDCADAGADGGEHGDDVPGNPARSSTLALAGSLPYCSRWPVEPNGEKFADTVRVEDPPPVLVVSGELDPITPAEVGERVADELGGHHVEVPRGGHAAMLAAPCAQQVLRSFVVEPDAPDLSCVEEMQPEPFT
jgi:pimeloyl-ACP methyl ester carboxylesterase